MKIRKFFKHSLKKIPILDGLFRRLIWSKFSFPENEMLILSKIPNGSIDVAIDVGAAMGSYSWILARKSNNVYAFEPGKDHYNYLKKVVFGTCIKLQNYAVGVNCGAFKMYTPGNDEGALHSATLSGENPISKFDGVVVTTVNQISLDSFFLKESMKFASIDLIKIDVEGYELNVLTGASKLIDKYFPLIICEIEERHNSSYMDTFHFLWDRGYKSFYYKNGEFHEFLSDSINELQKDKDLDIRLGVGYVPSLNSYINNFTFQHINSKTKLI